MSVGLCRMDWGGWVDCVSVLGLNGWSWGGDLSICTAPVPIGVPVAARSGVGGLSGDGIGTSAPSRGSGGTSAGGDVVAGVPIVTRVVVCCGRLQFSLAICKLVLLPWGEPEFPRGQG